MIVAGSPTRVLLVDQDEAFRSALQRGLVRLGYEVVIAESGEEAVEIVRRQKLACVVTELRLQGLAGPDLVGRLLDTEPGLAVVALTGAPDVEAAVASLQRGAMDYLAKPADLLRLAGAIRRALQRREAAAGQTRATRTLSDEVVRLTVELRQQQAGSERMSVALLSSLVYMTETRDPYLAGHSVRVSQMAAAMAAELGRADEEIDAVRAAGRLHDVGMLCIGDAILSKAGPLTSDELARVRQHALVGAAILAPLPSFGTVGGFIRSHHEQWDGGGYPDGLAGERIPWGAQLIGAAEVYDALTTPRPYRNPVPHEEAAAQVRELAGSMLSAEACDALAATIARRRALAFVDPGERDPLGALLEGRAAKIG